MQSVMQWKKKKAVKPHEMGLYSSPQAIQTQSFQVVFPSDHTLRDSHDLLH